ncbi:MAG: serine--tRNA ligase [Bdellovibrionales bacterium]|jgi:seryl-tRNA synthetase|nr:serine--tRNA ligase [Bdellovibrionales bacterium]
MIDIKALEKSEQVDGLGRSYSEAYRESLKNRGEDGSLVDQLLSLNSERKALVTQAEQARAEQNRVGLEIAKRKRAGENADVLLSEMQKLSSQIKEMTELSVSKEAELNEKLSRLPNICHHSVPIGKGEENNLEIRLVGEIPKFAFKAKDHIELGEALGIIDFERGGKVTGARFTFLRSAASALERALIQFMMNVHTLEHGYEEMIPPFIVNSQSLFGTGQFPKFREDVFHLENTDYYLVPTAEVPVTNYFAGEVLEESQLPLRFCAYSPCFRSEAGSYGKDTKGLIRQHQFNKVELVTFSHPDKSYEMHEALTSHAERILQKLELTYRLVSLCSGDIGFGAAKCYDLEVWLPGQEKFREISSCSNFEDFQSRRADIRFRPAGAKAKPRFVHTLNGSGLAVGRTLIAIIENYQQEDGSILIPKVLQPYMGGREVIGSAARS